MLCCASILLESFDLEQHQLLLDQGLLQTWTITVLDDCYYVVRIHNGILAIMNEAVL